MTTTREPNVTLRAVRKSMLLSQDDMARQLRAAGAEGVSKRQVQRWESGQAVPRAASARALEMVTGLPIASLGFTVQVPGSDAPGGVVPGEYPVALPGARPQARANFSGVWLSRYEYVSSGRGGETFIGLHYVVILQHGDRLTVRSLPGSSDSPLTMDLTVDGNVITGTWVEQTSSDGYYRGARYHGAIQLLVEPTGRRMRGKWVGFGAEMDVNTGPWELVLQDASTSKATMDAYNRRPTG